MGRVRRSVYCTASFSGCSRRRTELPIIYPDLRLDYKVATHPSQKPLYPAERWLRMSRSEGLRGISADGALHVSRAGIHEIANQDQHLTNLVRLTASGWLFSSRPVHAALWTCDNLFTFAGEIFGVISARHLGDRRPAQGCDSMSSAARSSSGSFDHKHRARGVFYNALGSAAKQ